MKRITVTPLQEVKERIKHQLVYYQRAQEELRVAEENVRTQVKKLMEEEKKLNKLYFAKRDLLRNIS